MKKMSTRIAALVLTFIMILGVMPLASLAADDTATLTRGGARDLLLDYVDDYNPAITGGAILRGYTDGTIKENQTILRIEALVMLARAFGPFPKPDRYWATTSHKEVTFTDVPAWAEGEIAALTAAGLLAPALDGLLHPYETMEREELEIMLRRIFAMFGTNLKDDFYATVNRTDLNELEIGAGMSAGSVLESIQVKTTDEIISLVEKATASTTTAGTAAHAIKSFYTTYVDTESRDREGSAFLAPFLSNVDKATTIAQLEQVRQDYLNTTGMGLLGSAGITPSEKDSTKYVSAYSVPRSTYGVEFYQKGDPKVQDAYREYLTTILTLSGESTQDATATASAYYDWEKEISAIELTQELMRDPTVYYNYIPYTTLVEKLENMNIAQNFSAVSLKADDQILVVEPRVLDTLAQLWTQENLARAKDVLRVEIVKTMITALGEDYFAASQKLENIFYDTDSENPINRRAVMVMQDYLTDALGQLYTEALFPPQSKAAVTTMTEDLVDIYAKRIDKLDWMSEATKTMAKKKLNAMDVNMGYPDQWDTTLYTAGFKTAAEGGTFIENLCKYAKTNNAANGAAQSKPVDKESWLIAVYAVNAYYYDAANSINFTAGILQAPLYDSAAKMAANLGGIGVIIGHEVSHGFDNGGSLYDEIGNLANWWTDADYAAFTLRCQAVENFFDGWEAAPGVAMSGTRTLSENLADIAGMSAALDLLESKEENPDYKAFFTNYAKIWQMLRTPSYAQQTYATDTHAAGNIRVNRVVVNFQQFYDAFGITEDDAMYVAPADRISIW